MSDSRVVLSLTHDDVRCALLPRRIDDERCNAIIEFLRQRYEWNWAEAVSEVNDVLEEG